MDETGPEKLHKPEYVPVGRVRWDTGDELQFDHDGWLHLLALAFKHGWRPQGTDEPEHWDFNPWARDRVGWWRGDYFSSVGQRITPSDAVELGVAIERALPDIPRGDVRADKALSTLDLPGRPPIHWVDPRTRMNALEYFSGPRRSTLEHFCGLCREDGFTLC